MKRLIFLMMICCSFLGSLSYGAQRFVDDDPILTNDQGDVVGAEISRDDLDPIRDGTFRVSENLQGIYNEEQVTDTGTTWQKTIDLIKGLVNYFLGIVGLVALIYMLYHAFIALTAGADDEKLAKGRKGIKYAAIALFGLGVAWFMLSLVFWLLQTVTRL